MSNFAPMYRFLAILLTLPYAAGLYAADPRSYLQLVADADKAIADSKWDDATELLRSAMRLEPSNPTNILLLSNIGMLYHYAGRDSLAIETLSTAHAMAPRSTVILQNRAKVYTSMNIPQRAIDDFSMTVSLDSTLIEPLYYRSMLEFHTGMDREAREDVKLLEQRFPGHTLTTAAKSRILVADGNFSEAIPLLTKLIEIQPSATDYSTLALCHLMAEDLSEASEDIAKGLDLDPLNGELFLYRALLNKMRYRPADAKADADKARKFGVSSARIKALGL